MIIQQFETQTVWQRLKNSKKPIVLYGMGNGARKIFNVFDKYGIKASDIFASENFIRHHSFEGIEVVSLERIKQKYDDFVIVMSFATQDRVVLDKIYSLSDEYELYSPDVPVFGEGLFDYEYLMNNIDKFNKVYSILSDDLSKQVFLDTINFKISGNIKYLKNSTSNRDEVFKDILNFSDREHYVDIGAYDGDTVEEFIRYTGNQYRFITAIEPDIKNFKKLNRFISENNIKNICAHDIGVWDKKEVRLFEHKAGRNSAMALNGRNAKDLLCDSVDNVLLQCEVPPSYIKFDVEGVEKRAVSGSINTIKKYKPKLNISLYHRNEDLFDLPLMVHEVCPQYKMYIRHHEYIPSWDTNLYCI